MELRTQSIYMSKKPARKGEKNSGEVITDQVHIPMNDLIADFIQAGGRLERAREEFYHDKYGKDEMEDFVPLTPGADPVEADAYTASVEKTILEKKALIDGQSESGETSEKGSTPKSEPGGKPDGDGLADNEGGTGSGGAS